MQISLAKDDSTPFCDVLGCEPNAEPVVVWGRVGKLVAEVAERSRFQEDVEKTNAEFEVIAEWLASRKEKSP